MQLVPLLHPSVNIIVTVVNSAETVTDMILTVEPGIFTVTDKTTIEANGIILGTGGRQGLINVTNFSLVLSIMDSEAWSVTLTFIMRTGQERVARGANGQTNQPMF